MNNLEKTLHINRLLDIYGKMLTSSQLDIMKDYYENDLSLSEISEIRNISRTAVSDTLKQGRQKLEKLEDNLGFVKAMDSLKDESNKEVLEQLEERIKNGI